MFSSDLLEVLVYHPNSLMACNFCYEDDKPIGLNGEGATYPISHKSAKLLAASVVDLGLPVFQQHLEDIMSNALTRDRVQNYHQLLIGRMPP